MIRKVNHQVTLKPQDLMVLLKLIVSADKATTYGELARSLGMSASEVHASVGRALSARLVHFDGDRPVVTRAAFREFVLHGAKYAFPVVHGPPTRGVPTAYAAPPLESRVTQPNGPPPVWPDADGKQRGISFYPLYPTAPLAARADRNLYELLALFDALRGGAARERQLASQLLSERLS